MARFASAVAAPSVTRTGTISKHFRIHDALIGEPTAAVAYAHCTGKVDLALTQKDLPDSLARDPRVTRLKKPTHAVTLRIRITSLWPWPRNCSTSPWRSSEAKWTCADHGKCFHLLVR
jgi:hypothetical protein